MDNENYWAAIYSFQTDFTLVKEIMPEFHSRIPGHLVFSDMYYIQYGQDTLIEILNPGDEISSFSAMITIYDYSKKQSTSTIFMDHVKMYYSTHDSITNSIEEGKGSSIGLCSEVQLNSICDSVIYRSHISKTEYKLFFNDTITNIRSAKLFYPDIKYLPYKIIKLDGLNNIFTLQNVIHGKSTVDSLLQLFKYDGYKSSIDENITPSDRQLVYELLSKLKLKVN
jgi:hypothetical protein